MVDPGSQTGESETVSKEKQMNKKSSGQHEEHREHENDPTNDSEALRGTGETNHKRAGKQPKQTAESEEQKETDSYKLLSFLKKQLLL